MKRIVLTCLCLACVVLAHALESVPRISTDSVEVSIEITAEGDTIYNYKYLPFDYGEILGIQNPVDSSEEPETVGPSKAQAVVVVDKTKHVGKIEYFESFGAAGNKMYSVPIKTASVSSKAPEVAISYNSNSQNGMAGYAWDISGLSSICAADKNIYYDGVTSAIDLSVADGCAYILDGMRLVKNIDDLKDEYQYETVQGFIKVKKHLNNGRVAYFTAKYPDGSTAIFGFTDNYENQLIYPVTEIVDFRGYATTFEYLESGNNYYISKIKYGALKGSQPLAEIHFSYSDREDCVVIYSAGKKIVNDKLLKQVVSYSMCNGALQELRTYKLTHSFVENVNRLVEIGCSVGSSSLNPLKFSYEYYNGTEKREMKHASSLSLVQYFDDDPVMMRGKMRAGSFSDGLIMFPGKFSIYGVVRERVNARGQVLGYEFGSKFPELQEIIVAPDVVGYSDVLSILAGKGFQSVAPVDVNGDGIDEIVRVNFGDIDESASEVELKFVIYYYNNGTLFYENMASVKVDGVLPEEDGILLSPMSRTYFYGDFLGLGKIQLLTVTHNESPSGNARKSTYALIDLDECKVVGEGEFFGISIEEGSEIYPVDFNGDGRDELCHASGNCMKMYEISASGYKEILSDYDIKTPGHECFWADINGDGNNDYIIPPKYSYQTYKDVYVPIWSPETCPYCGKDEPVIDKESDKCRYCGRVLRYKEPIYCRICGKGLVDELLSTPQCPDHGISIRKNVLYSEVDNGNEWNIYLSTGKGFVKETQQIVKNMRDENYLMIDMDNDNCAELVHTSGFTVTAYKNVDGVIQPGQSVSASIPNGLKLVPMRTDGYSISSNFLALDGAEVNSYVYSHDARAGNLLTGFTDSYGLVHNNKYFLMTSDGNYLYESISGDFPYYAFMAPIYLLENETVVMNGVTVKNTGYAYYGAVAHRQGLGFCGFRRIRSNDAIKRKPNDVVYDPYMFGLKVEEENNEEKSTYEYERNESSNKKCNPRLVKVSTHDKLNGLDRVKSYKYDSFNNVTQESYNPGDAALSTVTDISYRNICTSSHYFTGMVVTKSVKKTNSGMSWIERELYSYDDNSLLPLSCILYVGENGNVKEKETRWTYNSFGLRTSEKEAPRNLTNFIGKTFEYDADGRYMTSATDELGLTTTYSQYDKYGNCIVAYNHKGQKIETVYDDWGESFSTTNPDGTVKSEKYGWAHRDVGVYFKEKKETGKYNKSVYYDAMDNEVLYFEETYNDEYLSMNKEYDAAGRLVRVSQPYFGGFPLYWNEYTYDEHDRPLTLTMASGRSTQWQYGPCMESVTKEGINTTTYFNANNEAIKVTDPGGTINYTLRPDGQLTEVDVNGVVTKFEYDTYGNRTAIVDPNAGRLEFSEYYEGDVFVKTSTDARGKETVERYDRLGRVTSVSRPEFNTTYVYNEYGLLKEENSDNGTSITTSYDNFDRLRMVKRTVVDKTTNSTVTFSTQYSWENGNIVSKRYFINGPAIGAEYRTYSDCRLKSISFMDASRNTVKVWEAVKANEFEQVTELLYGENLAQKHVYTPYGYPSRIYTSDGLQDFGYEFDPATGNLLSRTDNTRNIVEQFGYDELNRLVDDNGRLISYAQNGNILSKEGVGTITYGNSAKPFQATSIDAVDDATYNRYELLSQYNSFNLPVFYECYNDVVMFDYNSRHEKVKNEYHHTALHYMTTYYLDILDYERYFYPSSKTVQRLYIGGDRYTAPAVCVCEDDVWIMYYILRDYLGSITHIVRADGELKQELSYDAWGNLRDPETHEVYKPEEQPELFLRRGYTGHEHLQWFNLINMNGRVYDPVLSRFLNPDPVIQKHDFTQNFNRYSYCLNNPFKYKDPSGKFIISSFFWGFVRALFKGENVLKGGFNAVLNSLKIYAGLFIPDKKKDFFGKALDLVSRFTWELPQTFVGYIFSQFRNVYVSVDVRFYGGATFVISYNKRQGVTIGNYINIYDNEDGAREKNKDFNPKGRYLYMHEYGHYLQSKLYGPSYLFVIGLPSLSSALFSDHHKYRWYEMNANWRGMEYFGIDRETWEANDPLNKYPLEDERNNK